jgi:nucleoside-diphosphate-sugar epimerase
MSRSLLVLGGSGFVGRAAVTEALQMGWEVTTFNRGVTGEPDPSAEAVVGDRRDPHALAPLVSRDWDLVIDTPLLARAGLILGPHENVGRLTWWLSRMARGGEILAPGPPDMPIQYIDARDLARFVITASSSGHTGLFNVVSARGHTTTGGLLDACKAVAGADDAELTWVDPETIAAAGIEPWLELPVWLPPQHEYVGMHHANVDRAHHAGLRCRSVSDTVGDAWHWLQSLNGRVPLRADLPTPGLSQERERAALNAWRDGRP